VPYRSHLVSKDRLNDTSLLQKRPVKENASVCEMECGRVIVRVCGIQVTLACIRRVCATRRECVYGLHP